MGEGTYGVVYKAQAGDQDGFAFTGEGLWLGVSGLGMKLRAVWEAIAISLLDMSCLACYEPKSNMKHESK